MVDEDKEIDENILSTEDVLSTDKEKVSTDMEEVSTDRPIVSTDGSKVSTDRQIEGTNEQVEGTEEYNEGTEEKNEGTEEKNEGTEENFESIDGHKKGTEEEIATQATQTPTQTPTSMIFGDDETIAKVLLNMSQAKAIIPDFFKGLFQDLYSKKTKERNGRSDEDFISIGSAEDERLIKNMNEKGVDSSKSEVLKEESKEEVKKKKA
ncbi:hypothetical protein Tco_0126658 [Tanacetum coccineum]